MVFAVGEWIPNLTVEYTLVKIDTGEKIEGHMSPMVANDGPHYGDNVKMLGAGRYKVTYRIENPLKQGFGRHTDRETGLGRGSRRSKWSGSSITSARAKGRILKRAFSLWRGEGN